ncbi:MAG TPA: hypothetical protein VNA19_04175 [Pyrinomonadaceae bacterium]|jgi:hypothetical protein|nr:hypothetical protein [Pyrinomonadaceae bacterium]
MSEKKGWGSTVVGWFVVQDEQQQQQQPDAGDATADDIISRYASEGMQTDAGTPVYGDDASMGGATSSSAADAGHFPSGPPPLAGGKVDFEAVFESAGVDAEERGRVAKAIELLQSLPTDTDKAVKKQIVEASLRAFGVPVEKIIEAGAEEIQALEFYIRAGAADTEQLISESEQRIKEYEEEIANIRKIMQDRVQEQQTVIKTCNDKKLEVQQILEFFGRDRVAAVVKSSPKLQDPSAAETTSGT